MTQTQVTKEYAGFTWELMIPSNIDTEINEGRDWEPCVSNWIRSNLKEGDVAVDVGANIGWFTLLMSKCVGDEGMVYAVEPEPSFRKRLYDHVLFNQIDNVRVYNGGLSDQSETCWISKNVGPYFSSATMERTYQAHQGAVQVNCRTLDWKISKLQVNFIKIDVDGWEMPVLRGARETIERCGPKIAMEIHDAAPVEFLESLGYEIWREKNPTDTVAISSAMIPEILTPGMPTINIFAVRK